MPPKKENVEEELPDLMAGYDNIGQQALAEIGQANADSEGVRLPFPTVLAWAHTGETSEKKNKDETPAAYYGGWAVDQGKILELIDAEALEGLPEEWTPYTGSKRGGGEWEGYVSRTVTVALIGKRLRWTRQEDNTASPIFDADNKYTRRHMQFLCQMFSRSEEPIAHVVLTAKGWQAQWVNDAFGEWDRAITKFRKVLNAQRIPIGGFAVTIGTTGPERIVKTVGQGANTSPLTPLVAVIPENLTAAMVAKRAIGPTNAGINAEKLAAAREWLEAWKLTPAPTNGRTPGELDAEPDDDELDN